MYARTNNLLTLVNVGSTNIFKLLLASSVVICDLYLFHIISLLNPDFRLVNNLISLSLDKVTTDTYNSHFFIFSVAPVVFPFITGGPASTCLCSLLVITQFLFHFNSKDTSQLINGIFNALQKLPKYFNGVANSIFLVPNSLPPAVTLYVLPIISFSYLNVSKLITFVLGKSIGLLSSVKSSL